MIRDYLALDADYLSVLDIQGYERPWTGEAIRGLVGDKSFAVRVKVLPQGIGKWIGYSVTRRAGNTLRLMRLTVRPDERRKGYGTELLEDCLAGLRTTVVVPESNVVALKFLMKNGFRVVNTLEQSVCVLGTREDSYYLVRN